VLVRAHRADDTVTRAVARILRSELIVIDDIGLLPVSLDAAEVPPAPPAAGPKASALSMQGAPGGLIRSGR